MIQLFGGSLTVLAFADFLVKNEKEFQWFTLGEKVGGHFSGMNIGGDFYDLGMVLLELNPGANNPTLYKPAENEKAALSTFLKGYDIREAEVKVLYENELYPDFIICDNEIPIKSDLGLIADSNRFQHHPKDKWHNEAFEKTSYHGACQQLYPEFYLEFLKNIASKITNDSANQLSCRYHRLAWLPLFYPETVMGETPNFQKYPMQTLKKQNFAKVLAQKIEKILKSRFSSMHFDNFEKIDGLLTESDPNVKKFVGCEIFKFSQVSNFFDENLFFRPSYDICVFRVKIRDDGIDCIFDTQDDFVFRSSIQHDFSSKDTRILFVEAKSLRQDSEIWLNYCENYVRSKLGFEIVETKLSKVGLLGPRMPKPGAEENMNVIKKCIDDIYTNKNFHIYGWQYGLNSLAMNKQINHALNIWSGQCAEKS